ncbi:MAG: SIMPL domain-containing protein [Acidobacteriota bacterium]
MRVKANWMTAVLVAGLGVPMTATAQARDEREAVVVVSGEGVVMAAPDLAWVRLAVESRSKNPKDAQAENARVMSRVHDALRKSGLPKDAARSVSFDLQLESDWVNGRQVPRGYLARNAIEARVDDITRVGEVIDAAIAGGATSVHNVRFDLKQREALEREALKRASADARARADAAAAGVGATIGRVVRIEEPAARQVAPMPVMMAREAVSVEARVTTPVVPGEIEIRALVLLTATIR